jgi:hypothetical protein
MKRNYTCILYLSFDFQLTRAVFEWNTSASYSSNEIFLQWALKSADMEDESGK